MIDFNKYFFWVVWPYDHVFKPFWWIFAMLVVFLIPFLRPWWWIFAPLFLSMELRTLYLWWVGWDFEYAQIRWVVLELIPPKEILIPLKAMEDVFASLFRVLHDNANFRELWCEGELGEAPYWMSWEIASVEGAVHFYARVMSNHRVTLESLLYSHYPELEIQEVPDYARNVPQNIPNEDWDLYGEEYISDASYVYPIKTYEKFFEPQGEKISAEEKRIDPINSLVEAMSRLGPGEQYWVQYIITSAEQREGLPALKKEAERIIAGITKRSVKKEKTLWSDLLDVAHNIVIGPKKEGSGEKATYKWLESNVSESDEREMLMTPGERATVTEIEDKMKKAIYRTTMRGLYIAKRDNWRSSSGKLLRSYTSHFKAGTAELKFDSATRTKVHFLLRKRRVFLRARRMLRNAVLRFPAYFPDRSSGCAFFSAEEMATLFHFPFKISSLAFPTVERVEHRKGGPPPNLPIG